MKRFHIAILASLLTAMVTAQTLNVQVGNVTYQFPAAQTGEMTYANGSTVTIMGKVFSLSDIDVMTVDDSEVTDNLVSVEYSNTSAMVYIAGNVAQYVTPTVSGAHVSIAQSNTAAVDGDEITYQLSGSTSDGSLTLSGSYKCTVSLAGVTMTNPSGTAINITNSKRIQLSAKKGTENTLTDGSGSQKACIYSKGQLQLQGNGTLNVVGNYKHGIKSASYITIKNLTLNITSSVSDGINCEEYFLMTSGTVSISGVGDDGIQCDLGGTTSTGETTDHEDEDSGNMYLEGGTLTIKSSATASKGIKAGGDITISDGTINVTTNGHGMWDSDDSETKAASGISADGNITISGGTTTLTSSGGGGKGLKCDGTLTITDGTLNATTTGGIYYNNGKTENTNYTGNTDNVNDSYKSSPKAIKSAGAMTISGGTIIASSSKHEGIESKSTLTITGGYVYSAAGDDAMNSAGDFTISGGYVFGNSSGNDGLDANGNFYIKGGNVIAVASKSPEVGIDANTEERKQLYITGGNIVTIGGFESGASISNGTAKQTSSYNKGSWYGLYNGSALAFAYKVPTNSSMGSSMAVYTTGTPALKSGVTVGGTSFWNSNGYNSCSGGSTVTLNAYSGGNGGPGGGGGPGGRW